MPKQKTHSGASKRFRVTGTGKIRRERCGHRHYLERKESRLARRLEGTVEVSPNDAPRIKRMLGR
ncbi:large subunit ribosomal protein L35 [Actinoalloteichus hoggarensis]|uniref:Large ribosomal subunit protein bL35 n=2 Tax=Actinoalloteichus TaxID=65496 RepID=A0A221W695_9PSEU|nr:MULTISPECIES: 50S ribosomal protein L35 [Actinoalloteichus]APU16361.1 ribosomal protein L35 [Actinoalloteichus fjordicus]APU22419.1 ribosomal protein L35 [Actinoalloteichus sp. GBA129-24]ASO21450.1 50S ribosomal protein L35 [Actinoalloteichus hoggarensis]MBB5922039.1 large subunit ribosomal protein L35 [Actinoalloteichus hoggarensis]